MTPFHPCRGARGWRPPLRAVVALALCLAGLILVGQASYIHAKAWLAQILLEQAFAEARRTGRPVKPWSWADTWPVARIIVPRIGRSAIALAGASGQALAFGPGHLHGTPPPGAPGTAVYAAHRDTHFDFLRHVEPGDTIEIETTDGLRHGFVVTHTSIAHWNRNAIDPSAAGRNLVLATCWPFEARTPGPLRYLVHARVVATHVPAAAALAAPTPNYAASRKP